MTTSIEKAMERLDGSTPPMDDERGTTPAEQAPAERSDEPVLKLDFSQLEKAGYLTPHSGQSKLAEEYRMLKRPVLHNAFGKGAAPVERGNLVMVLSALPGEGKTFTALNLAMSMTLELDTTVLLVDADVIKPSLTGLLGLAGRPGLTDVLIEKNVELGDVILNTELSKLRVLPAGKIHVHSTELLASEQMTKIAAELSERYPDRIVLFDGPPILATSQAVVLADLVGQVLLVVEAGRTPQHAVKEALSHLNQDKVIGTVLNKSRRSFTGDYYGAYYGSYGS